MKGMLDEAELARLEKLALRATAVPYHYFENSLRDGHGNQIAEITQDHDDFAHDIHDTAYIAAACNAVPALVAEVRRLREKVEALEWWDEVRQYTLFKHHPLWWADGHRTPEGNRYANAEKEYDEIRKAAFDDVYRGRPC